MSGNHHIVVNCGATQVGVSVFSHNSGRLVLDRLVVEDLDYDYAGEDAWLGALSVALSGIVRGLKLSGPASVVVPGYQLLTKSIRVPHVEKAKQAQIIGFEAQNQIPYPLAEVVWDSQIISTDGVEAEVMLFALKQDVATRIAGVITAAGLTPSVLEASTILDYQAWRAANPGEVEEVLIINIGARTTNMTFVNAAGFSVHNVNVGGNFLTQSIADAMAQPFRTAENVKVAYFSGERQLDDGDPHALMLRQNAQAFMRRISQEVTRRIVTYKRQNQNSQPKKIILTGRGSLLPGLSEHLLETQRISVDYFDPYPAFSASASVDAAYLESCRVRLSEIVGEASRPLLREPVGVNLLPAALEGEIAFNRQRPLLVAAAVLFAIAPWFGYAHFLEASSSSKKQLANVDRRVSELNGYKAGIASATAESESVKARLDELRGAVDARDNWREFLTDLQSRVGGVKDVWVSEMRFKRTPGAAPAAATPSEEEKPAAAPAFVPDSAKVTVTFGMLIKEVAPGAAFNSDAFTARRRELVKALKASPFVAEIPARDEKSDLSKGNMPKLTLTLVIKQDKKPL